MVGAIQKKLSTGFHDWLGFPTYRNLPFRDHMCDLCGGCTGMENLVLGGSLGRFVGEQGRP